MAGAHLIRFSNPTPSQESRLSHSTPPPPTKNKQYVNFLALSSFFKEGRVVGGVSGLINVFFIVSFPFRWSPSSPRVHRIPFQETYRGKYIYFILQNDDLVKTF